MAAKIKGFTVFSMLKYGQGYILKFNLLSVHKIKANFFLI